jgi:hypothetical protein
VIRRRLVANLTGPAVAGRPDETVAALPSPTPSKPPDTARRPDHEITEAVGGAPERLGRYALAPSSSS